MYGYREPELQLPEGATAQTVRDLRRRLVYEPDHTYFPGLQLLCELAAQANPVLSYKEIADEMDHRKAPPYFSTIYRYELPWTAMLVAHVLRREYPREFVRGN